MELKITVLRAENGNLAAYAPYELFQFIWRKETLSWLFWLRGNYNPYSFPGKEFPRKFFEDACRAVFFIKNGGPMPDNAVIVEGEELIKKYK